MKLEFTGFLREGKLHIRNRNLLDIELPIHFKEGQDIEITFERKFKKRSIFQNRYYFSVCVAMIAERFNELGTPCTRENAHEFLKGKFLFTECYNEKTGEIFSIPKSTAELSTTEFMEFIDNEEGINEVKFFRGLEALLPQ